MAAWLRYHAHKQDVEISTFKCLAAKWCWETCLISVLSALTVKIVELQSYQTLRLPFRCARKTAVSHTIARGNSRHSLLVWAEETRELYPHLHTVPCRSVHDYTRTWTLLSLFTWIFWIGGYYVGVRVGTESTSFCCCLRDERFFFSEEILALIGWKDFSLCKLCVWLVLVWL